MKVFLVMEILHDFQVGLQSFNLMGEVLGLVLKVVQSVMLLKGPCLARWLGG